MKIHSTRLINPIMIIILFNGFGSWVCSKNPPLDPEDHSQESLIFLISLQSRPAVLAPGDSATIYAKLVDQDGQPVAGDTVQFTSNLGSISPSSSTTNDSGLAVTTFRAPAQTGTATIKGIYQGNQTQVLNVEIQNNTPNSITLEAEKNSLLADGASTTEIYSTWLTEDGQPLISISVSFQTSVGSITASAVTDSAGKATALLTSAASREDLTANITATSSGLQASTQVLFKGIEFTLSAVPMNLIADGKNRATITGILKEARSHIAIAGATVTFGTDLGTIPNSAISNSSGVVEVELTSSLQTGLATVTANVGNKLTETVQVSCSQSLPAFINLTASPTIIVADNQSEAKITAMVTDQDNNPVPDGTQVTFEIVDGTGTIESNKATVSGVAISKLTSSIQPDTVTIVGRVDDLTDTTTVQYIVGEAAAIKVTADSLSLPANGISGLNIRAHVFDAVGHAVRDGTKVDFTTDLGEITSTAQTVAGVASAQFTSSVTGIATVKASVGGVVDELSIQLLPGPPNSILLSFDPQTLGVKDSGRNQALTITAVVVDSKNNPVRDGTFVKFSIFASPGGGEFLSSTEPIPTLNGQAQVSLNSGIRSGAVRIMAQVTDELGVPIAGVSAATTEVLIHAGPPYIENVNDRGTSHLTVGVKPLNVFGWEPLNVNSATVTVVVGDKFNNPVPAGTAVYLTTSGGVVITQAFTDDQGVATVTIHTGQPNPDITRFYNTFFDPNDTHADFTLSTNVIPGPIPDFEHGEVFNSVGNYDENDGIARILAVTEGLDRNGSSARAWSVVGLVFSGIIDVFDIQVSDTTLSPGETASIDFKIYDVNGNPIVPGSEIIVKSKAGELSWNSFITSDPGVTRYHVQLTNDIDPSDPEAQAKVTTVTIEVKSENGNIIKSSQPIFLDIN